MRLELTAFRLWDWRAAYCATEAWWKYYLKLKISNLKWLSDVFHIRRYDNHSYFWTKAFFCSAQWDKGCIKSPNLNLRFSLQSEPYDLEIVPYWIKDCQSRGKLTLNKLSDTCFRHWRTAFRVYFLSFFSVSSKHLGRKYTYVSKLLQIIFKLKLYWFWIAENDWCRDFLDF